MRIVLAHYKLDLDIHKSLKPPSTFETKHRTPNRARAKSKYTSLVVQNRGAFVALWCFIMGTFPWEFVCKPNDKHLSAWIRFKMCLEVGIDVPLILCYDNPNKPGGLLTHCFITIHHFSTISPHVLSSNIFGESITIMMLVVVLC